MDVGSSQLVDTFTPCRELRDEQLPPSEPPITRMFTSSDGQWLAAVNCFGDVYIFNLEILRFGTTQCQAFTYVTFSCYLFLRFRHHYSCFSTIGT